MTGNCEHAVKRFFGSYLNAASSVAFAEGLSESFHKSTGILVEVKEVFLQSMSVEFDGIWFTDWSAEKFYKKPIVIQEKPKHWKPWHDLKNNQLKKSWKHC